MKNSRYVLSHEGKVKLWIPNRDLYLRPDGIYEPSWAPVFYNPTQILNRDLTVALLKVLKTSFKEPRRALDAFAGTGVRALRIAVEVGGFSEIYATDISEESYKLILRNLNLNGLGNAVKALRIDANAFMYLMKSLGKTFTFIDIDPYGTPAPYIPASVWAIRSGGIIGVTATDTAPLGGTKWRAGSRRYLVNLRKYDIPHYIGLRVLVGFIARVAASADRWVEPLLSLHDKHYHRVFLRVSRSSSRAASMLLEELGYIIYCGEGRWRRVIEGLSLEGRYDFDAAECEKPALLGPLWIGRLGAADLVSSITLEIKENLTYLSSRDELLHLLNLLKQEAELRNVYNIASIASHLRVNVPKISEVIQCLKNSGFKATRSHLCSTCIATDAEWGFISSCVGTG